MGTVQSCPTQPNNMKVLIVFGLALAAASAIHLDTEWEAFKAKYQKGFLSATHHDERKAILAANLERIEKHNAEHAEGKHTYWLGVNQPPTSPWPHHSSQEPGPVRLLLGF